MLRSETFTIAHGEIAGLTVGDVRQSDYSVLFLHGWLDNAASFIRVISFLQQLAPEGHFCAIDLPGHGLSSHKPAANYYSFHDYIDDVYQVLHNLSPNRLVLVGHSLGALIASCYSAAFPEQVAGLVQIEGFLPLAEDPVDSVQRLRQGVLSRQRVRRKPTRYYYSVEEAIEHRARVNQLPAELIEPVVRRGLHHVGTQWQWRHDNKLLCDSLYRQTPQHARAVMNNIVCPHHVILGDQGFASLQTDLTDYIGQPSQSSIVAGGHHCHLQQPLLVAELILGLVNKI
ncbi:alpha/beta hydrolase [Vibrio metschnikovii]|uniref:alpha/beta fold hydrolase n=1 Tax=Vibrio TaxID=662 RepID=UPI001302A0C1|nr:MULTISPECIES: alpha/beta hydrolase [Vibrio]EKO3671619.1 alpha/beta hydrolase [Vibrio metschnikovii]EKO3694705.1 alpha/beta hydrolase [Vibrio metschnikovii]EKO3922863.1 alpha/beta hydrolase [Vibrio metschnikovii]NAW79563.1 alpha/beta fold hydrolase [Vibrio sp. V33_P6A3T137]